MQGCLEHETLVYGIDAIVEVIARPLTYIKNCCLKAGVFLDQLNTAHTVLIYKKGDLSSTSLPLLVILAFSKIVETLMKN